MLELMRMDRFDLGSYTKAVSTASAEAQRWFDKVVDWMEHVSDAQYQR